MFVCAFSKEKADPGEMPVRVELVHTFSESVKKKVLKPKKQEPLFGFDEDDDVEDDDVEDEPFFEIKDVQVEKADIIEVRLVRAQHLDAAIAAFNNEEQNRFQSQVVNPVTGKIMREGGVLPCRGTWIGPVTKSQGKGE